MGLLLFLFQYMAAIRWHRPGSDWNLHRRPDLRRCSAAARFRKPAQQVAVTETTMPVLRESRMIGHFAVETQSTKPAIRQVEVHLLAQPPLRADAEAVADDQHPDQQLGINRWPPHLTVKRRQFLPQPVKFDEPIDRPQEVPLRYMSFE